MTTKRPTPAWLLERLAQGELDAAATEDLRARLAAEGRSLEEELQAIKTSDLALREAMPKQRAAAAIRARLASEAPAQRPGAWRWALPAAAAAAMTIVFAARMQPGDGGPTSPAEIEETRDKGLPSTGSRLVVFRQRAAQPEQLADGARARRGDLLQLAYIAREAGYGVILSVDGSGQVTQHLPEGDATTAARLRTPREVRLPASYELDDAPAFERFFLVTAPSPFAVAPVLAAARTLASSPAALNGALPLPAGFTQTSLRLEKPSAKEKP
jgi:hypothetical protein